MYWQQEPDQGQYFLSEGKPSGKRSERKGSAKDLPCLFCTGMLRAREAVPHGGASHTKKGL